MPIRKVGISRGKKKLYHHPDLRNQLVQSTIAFLKKHRIDDLSLRGIARELGVSHMAPYRHFSTKEELLAAVIEDGFLKLSAMFDEVAKQEDQSFKAVFTNLGKAYIQFVVKSPDQARLMFSGLMCDPKKHPGAHFAGQESFGRLVKMIEAGKAMSHLSANDETHMQALMMWSAVHGTAMLIIENQFSMIDGVPEFQVDAFANFMAEKLLTGLK